jgi:hypothetical protein
MEHARAWAMVETMADMQESYNREVHPDWRTQEYPFYRAVWVECAELLDHFGWKWWKHQRPDLDQVKLEIVDIWHFGMSDMLRAGTLVPEIVGPLLEPSRLGAPAATAAEDPESFRAAIEHLAQETLTARQFVLEPFAVVLGLLPLPFDELFRLYVGKNVLNSFRLDFGYKTGTYAKRWGDREDNEHLVEVLAALAVPPEAVPARLYAELEVRYRMHLDS